MTIGEDVVRAPDAMSQGEFDARAFLETLDASLPSLLVQAGTMKGLGEALATTEPWSAHGSLVRDHLKKNGWADAIRE